MVPDTETSTVVIFWVAYKSVLFNLGYQTLCGRLPFFGERESF